MSSFLDVKEGIFLPAQRFSFTNITDVPFMSRWGGVPVVVGPHESIEISDHTPFMGVGNGHALAVKFTGELVDQIFMGKAKAERGDKDLRDWTRNSVTGMMMGVPSQRKIYEDQILKKLEVDDSEGSVQILKNQMVQQLQADASKKEGVAYEEAKGFSEIPKGGFQDLPKPERKNARTKKIDASPETAS